MDSVRKKVVIICGPTAVGKTSLAIQVAVHYGTRIISADSRQCYRELNIGVAKPSPQELKKVYHYFINSHSIHEDVNAGLFEQYALHAANEIFTTNNIVVMVGGSGLFIKAFCEGIDDIPLVHTTIRQKLNANYNELGLTWLQREVQHEDPEFWKIAEQQNPRRLLRALEVKLATGRSITQFRTGFKAHHHFDIIKIGLEVAKDQLYHNIDERVNDMMNEGLLEEVKHLLPYYNHSALHTVGYRELFEHLNGRCALEECITNIKANTRKYAKRQMTWFKKDSSVYWHLMGPHILDDVLKFLSC